MANVFSVNNSYLATNNTTESVWRLTRVMKKAGWLVVASANGAAKVAPATNASDNWGNAADPLTDIYPSSFNTAINPWIVMQGPTTIKIPLTSAPSGSPLRGEKITQGSTEGELLGYVFDPVSSSGWMVVAPRIGTFAIANGAISCSISGATFTPTGIIVSYVREVMIVKTISGTDNTSGQVYYICADPSSEGTQLYSSLAQTAGATVSIAPGCAASGVNAFPALGIVIRGIAGTMTPGSSFIMSGVVSGYIGSYHTACANTTPGANVSADGSFYLVGSNSGASTGGYGFIYTKVDDSDPGDCDPYVFSTVQNTTLAAFNRTTSTSYSSSPSSLSGQTIFTQNSPCFLGYQARGCPIVSRDVVCPYVGALNYAPGLSGGTVLVNYPQSIRTLNHPATNPPLTRENLLIYTSGITTGVATIKHYKGRARWISVFSQGSWLDTFDNKKFLCTSSLTSSYVAIAIGPWDASTTPIA